MHRGAGQETPLKGEVPLSRFLSRCAGWDCPGTVPPCPGFPTPSVRVFEVDLRVTLHLPAT